jgi:hypothetical protein
MESNRAGHRDAAQGTRELAQFSGLLTAATNIAHAQPPFCGWIAKRGELNQLLWASRSRRTPFCRRRCGVENVLNSDIS